MLTCLLDKLIKTLKGHVGQTPLHRTALTFPSAISHEHLRAHSSGMVSGTALADEALMWGVNLLLKRQTPCTFAHSWAAPLFPHIHVNTHSLLYQS